MTLRHLLTFDEKIWYHRCMRHRKSWGLNPEDPYHIRLLEEIFNATNEYWRTLGERITDWDHQVAYDYVFTGREAYKSHPEIIDQLKLGRVSHYVHIVCDLIHLLNFREWSPEHLSLWNWYLTDGGRRRRREDWCNDCGILCTEVSWWLTGSIVTHGSIVDKCFTVTYGTGCETPKRRRILKAWDTRVSRGLEDICKSYYGQQEKRWA